MSYENPKAPEGINYSQENPLKEFAWLVIGVSLVLVVTVVVIAFSVEKLAPFIPFQYEVEVAERFSPERKKGATHVETERYLQALSDRLAKHADFPKQMTFKVHYVDDAEVVNAFATLGGNIVIFSGLLNEMPSENALAMVMAHEMAHVIHRDPIVALGRGLIVSLVLTAVTGSDSTAIAQHLNTVGLVTMLAFNRDQESAADELALKMVQSEYGHVAGTSALFDYIQAEYGGKGEGVAFMQSHPLTQDRIDRIQSWGIQAGDLTPLPILSDKQTEEPK